MSEPTKAEVRAAEEAMQARFLDAITGSLTSLPLSDLTAWNFRAEIWSSMHPHLDAILSQAKGRPGVAKFLAMAAIYKLSNMLLGGEDLPRGQSDAEILRERITAAAAAEAKPVTSESEPEPITDEPQPQSTCTKLSDGRIQVAFVRPNGQVCNFVANRQRSRPRTYAEIMARKTPQQQAEFRRKRRDMQRRYRASRKLAFPGS
jgi:hypothetical protein